MSSLWLGNVLLGLGLLVMWDVINLITGKWGIATEATVAIGAIVAAILVGIYKKN